MKLPAEWLDFLQKLQKEFPEACIAGGALRDLVLNRPIKDIDFWIKARGDDTEDALESVIGEVSELMPNNIRLQYEEHFSELYAVYEPHEDIVLDLNQFETLLDDKPVFQIIALNREITLDSVVERFDFGLCKIATNGREDLIHPHFIHDAINQCFTLRAPNDGTQLERSQKRHDRLVQKYQGWQMITPPEKLMFE